MITVFVLSKEEKLAICGIVIFVWLSFMELTIHYFILVIDTFKMHCFKIIFYKLITQSQVIIFAYTLVKMSFQRWAWKIVMLLAFYIHQ